MGNIVAMLHILFGFPQRGVQAFLVVEIIVDCIRYECIRAAATGFCQTGEPLLGRRVQADAERARFCVGHEHSLTLPRAANCARLLSCGLLALDHFGIAVRDLEAACERWGALGLEAEGREEVPHEQVRVAMLPLASGRIELLEPTSPDSAIARFLGKRGEGLHHVALRVPDLAAAVERMKRKGMRLVNEAIQTGAGGHKYVFVHPASTGGVLLELIEDHA